MLNALLEKVKQAIHNPECLSCRKALSESVSVCEGCLDKLGFREPFPLVQKTHFQSHAATVFNAKIKQLIYGYKFFNKQEHVRLLSHLLTAYWQERGLELYDPASTWVVFVPPHGKRHPHMAALARRFSEHFGYQYKPNVLQWRHETLAQRTLSTRRKRFENVKDCLMVKAEMKQEKPGNVIVLDDITTTGATLYEATQAFYRTGWFEDSVDYNQIVGLTVTSVPMTFQQKQPV